MAHEKDEEPRERIVRTASELFRKYGFQAVGVDMIVAESSVAKMTLYRHFDSKDHLIEEFLRREDAEIRSWVRRVTGDLDDPKSKIARLFEALAARTSGVDAVGCPFQIAVAEFPDPNHPANKRARTHKQSMRAILRDWVSDVGLNSVGRTTDGLYLLMEGAWAASRMPLGTSPTASIAAGALLILEGGLFLQAVAPRAGERTNRD